MVRTLHNYFRSSASYRVRIAMNLKQLPYEYVPVHLNRNGGEQFGSSFLSLNPQALVPVLEDDDVCTSQSLAILEYLEERYPERPLLPSGLAQRAYVRRIASFVACDIHPLHNLRVLKFLTGPLQLSEELKMQWIQHWIGVGLTAIEREIEQSGFDGRFCLGDTPTMADCCLVPQIFSAQRFGVDLTTCPTLLRIHSNCDGLEEFRRAVPSAQVDAE